MRVQFSCGASYLPKNGIQLRHGRLLELVCPISYEARQLLLLLLPVKTHDVYLPGGGSGGGLGSCVSRRDKLAKADRVAMCRATSTGRCQRSSTERSVGAAWQSNRCFVECRPELHSGQRSVSEILIACL